MKDEQWISIIQEGHTGGINCLSWAPFFFPVSFQVTDNNLGQNFAPMRFVTGGCDNYVKVWTANSNIDDISKLSFNSDNLEAHTDWVRDVSWLNSIGNTNEVIASCGEDEYVYLWIKKEDTWNKLLLKKFNTPIWRVSWSHCGSFLAISAADNSVYIYKVK